jgi:hypothetical protein
MDKEAGTWNMPVFGIGRGVEFWVRWNLLCEGKSLFTFQVEDLNPGSVTARKLQDVIGFPDRQFPELPKNVASANKRLEVTREMALQHCPDFAPKAFALAEKYGYVWE